MDWTCQSCGDKEPNTRIPVLRRSADSGELEEIYVCETCAPRFEQVIYLFQNIDGHIFPFDEEFKVAKNDRPLDYSHNHIFWYSRDRELAGLDEDQRQIYLQKHALDPTRLPLDDFPLVEDFEVLLIGIIAQHEIGKERIKSFNATLYSPTLGILGDFSVGTGSSYMCRPDFLIPGGDFLLPYYDFEQNISLLITEDEQFVYILYANDWDYVPTEEQDYNSWVKVHKEKYYEQWHIAIQKSLTYHKENLASI